MTTLVCYVLGSMILVVAIGTVLRELFSKEENYHEE